MRVKDRLPILGLASAAAGLDRGLFIRTNNTGGVVHDQKN